MNISRAAVPIVLLSCLLLGTSGCKKNPIAAPLEVDGPTIVFVCNPSSARSDATVSAFVFIKGNTKQIRVFGLDMTFDPQLFQFQEVLSGTLTAGWAAVDGNEIGRGSLKVGGFVGGGTAIPIESEGTLAEIRFRVKGVGYGNGQTSQVCVQRYTDDLIDFKPNSTCFTFTYIQ